MPERDFANAAGRAQLRKHVDAGKVAEFSAQAGHAGLRQSSHRPRTSDFP
jgi:hypothetical protein